MGVQVKLWNSLRTRAIPEHFCSGDSLRRGAISSVCTFTFTFTFRVSGLHTSTKNTRQPKNQAQQWLLISNSILLLQQLDFPIDYSTSDQVPSVLWRCWLGERMDMRSVKNWMLVCWWWWFDRSFARLTAPVVITTSITLAPIKSRMETFLVPANLGPPGKKWPLNWRQTNASKGEPGFFYRPDALPVTKSTKQWSSIYSTWTDMPFFANKKQSAVSSPTIKKDKFIDNLSPKQVPVTPLIIWNVQPCSTNTRAFLFSFMHFICSFLEIFQGKDMGHTNHTDLWKIGWINKSQSLCFVQAKKNKITCSQFLKKVPFTAQPIMQLHAPQNTAIRVCEFRGQLSRIISAPLNPWLLTSTNSNESSLSRAFSPSVCMPGELIKEKKQRNKQTVCKFKLYNAMTVTAARTSCKCDSKRIAEPSERTCLDADSVAELRPCRMR